jgi:hypothetical protein
MEVFVFKKAGFKNRQSAKLKGVNDRGNILISCHLNSDQKIGLLHSQKDYTLLATYQEILFNLDLETETWEISATAFKDWFRKTFSVNNRFKIEERLEWLSNVGLIEFKRVSYEVSTGEVSENNSETIEKVFPNNSETFAEVYPLEPAETLTALHATITNQHNKTNTTNQQTNAPERGQAAGCFFEISLRGQEMREDEWIYRCFLESRRSKKLSVEGCHDLKSLLSLYPGSYDRYRRWVTQPIARRMAAFAYTALHSNADDMFKYALKALEEGDTWERMPGYIQKAEVDVKQNDLRVVIS